MFPNESPDDVRCSSGCSLNQSFEAKISPRATIIKVEIYGDFFQAHAFVPLNSVLSTLPLSFLGNASIESYDLRLKH